MARRRDMQAELARLKDDLVRDEGQGQRPAAQADEKPDDGFGIESLLAEFQSYFSEATDEAEDLISAHPLAAVGCALALGILIGRYTRRA